METIRKIKMNVEKLNHEPETLMRSFFKEAINNKFDAKLLADLYIDIINEQNKRLKEGEDTNDVYWDVEIAFFAQYLDKENVPEDYKEPPPIPEANYYDDSIGLGTPLSVFLYYMSETYENSLRKEKEEMTKYNQNFDTFLESLDV